MNVMINSEPKRTFLEFFAGIGLVRWALEREDWICVFANDIDQDKKCLYDDNFTSEEYVLKDVNTLSAREVPSAVLAVACSLALICLWREKEGG